MPLRYFFASSLLTLCFYCFSSEAKADPISWNTWTSNSTGSIGTIGVSYATTNFHAMVPNYPSWEPSTTFADGILVDNAPDPTNGIMRLIGGTNAVNTLAFNTEVVNPVLAIWSLGGPFDGAASFVFDQTPTFVAGGPSNETNGSAITILGNVVSGLEANGTVQFFGTFTSLSWTNPQFENWYGFNVGIAGVPTNTVPEPTSLSLLGLGSGLAFLAWRTKKKTAV